MKENFFKEKIKKLMEDLRSNWLDEEDFFEALEQLLNSTEECR